MHDWKVPLFDLDLSGDEYERVKGVLHSKWLTMGPVTKDFESAFAEYLGVKHAIGVSSGTAALHLAHHAMGLECGDEVVCPSLTFVATANTISYTGATPVFADIKSLEDLTISADEIESKIGEKTRGIVLVHYAGFPCDMDGITDVARKYNLFVVEDCAHAVGAAYSSKQEGRASRLKGHGSREEEEGLKWRAQNSKLDNGRCTTDDNLRGHSQVGTDNSEPLKVGTIGNIGCFSFFGNKNMTTAEGGMVVTNRDDLAEKVMIARSHGMTSLTWDRHKGHDFSYDVVDLGYNYRIDELRSGLGLAQLSKLDGNNGKRGELWTLYAERLKDIDEIEVPFSHCRGISSYHILPVLLAEKVSRRSFMEYLRDQGIQTSIHYPPVHLFTHYRKVLGSETCLPLTEYVGRREVTLPLYPTMNERQVEHVANAIEKYLASHCE